MSWISYAIVALSHEVVLLKLFSASEAHSFATFNAGPVPMRDWASVFACWWTRSVHRSSQHDSC
jgi:hypothetical protein